VLMVLSGPEPQRTVLEELLTKQARDIKLKCLLVRGVSEGSNEIKHLNENFFIADFMVADQLNDAFLSSDIIVARSGYSTVMDLVALGKKAIFIPTPGQTEQEHLAENFLSKKLFYAESQGNFNLNRSLEHAKNYPGITLLSNTSVFNKELDLLLNNLTD